MPGFPAPSSIFTARGQRLRVSPPTSKDPEIKLCPWHRLPISRSTDQLCCVRFTDFWAWGPFAADPRGVDQDTPLHEHLSPSLPEALELGQVQELTPCWGMVQWARGHMGPQTPTPEVQPPPSLGVRVLPPESYIPGPVSTALLEEEHVLAKPTDPRVRLPGFQSQPCHIPAPWPPACHLTSLSQFPHQQNRDDNSMSSKDRREGPVISWLEAIQHGATYVLFLWQETGFRGMMFMGAG